MLAAALHDALARQIQEPSRRPATQDYCRQYMGMHGRSLAAGIAWTCPRCHGAALTMPVLRTMAGEQTASEFWTLASTASASSRLCPVCQQPVRALTYTGAAEPLEIDLCQACQTAWFDRGELDAVPRTAMAVRRPETVMDGRGPKPPANRIALGHRVLDEVVHAMSFLWEGTS